MLRLLAYLHTPPGSSDLHKIAYERATSLHGFWFIVIESAIIMGALSVAAERMNSPFFWAIYLVSYILLGLVMLTAVQYVMSLAAEQFGWVTQPVQRYVRDALSWVVAMTIPYILSGLVAEFIEAGLGAV